MVQVRLGDLSKLQEYDSKAKGDRVDACALEVVHDAVVHGVVHDVARRDEEAAFLVSRLRHPGRSKSGWPSRPLIEL